MLATLRSWHQYLHLLTYPHLLRFCAENQVHISPFSLDYSELILKDIVASGIPKHLSQGYRMRKKEINECLGFGYRHKLLSRDYRARLSRDDPVNFWALISELKTGIWLENQGFEFEGFQPPSAQGGKGDYLIEKGGNPVFIEVKTVFGERYILDQESLTADFARYCQENQLPVKSINLLQYPRGYNYKIRKDCLFKAIETSIVSHLPLMNELAISYEDKDGISIEFLLSLGASRVVSRLYGGFSDIGDNLKERLGMCDTETQRRLRVSGRNIPSIYVFNDFGHNIEQRIIEAVLYGNSVHDETKNAKTEYYRKNDGRLVQISTDYVFGGDTGHAGTPYIEFDETSPLNVYGKSKLAGERLVEHLSSRYFIIRVASLFGVAGSSGKGGNFIETILRLGKERSEVRVVDDQIFSPTYTADAAKKIAELIQTDCYGTFHCTNHGSCSWYEFTKEIYCLCGLKTKLFPITSSEYPQKAKRPPYSVLDNFHLRLLKMDDMRDWKDALRAYLIEKGHISG